MESRVGAKLGPGAGLNQAGTGIRLPNFCNLGVRLLSLIIVNLLFAAAAVLKAYSLKEIGYEFVVLAAFGEPILILSLVALCGARRLLHAMGYLPSIAAVIAFELLMSWLGQQFFGGMLPDPRPMPFPQLAFLVLFATATTVAYFDLRSRALSPAIAEARIQALQARIRPHFLYNSINAVLSLMRSEPRPAGHALEDMADLFPVLMPDNRKLPPIAVELELARQYLP